MARKKILFSLFLIIFGVLFRIFLNKAFAIPNFESVTALSLVSGSFLGGLSGPIIPLFIIFLSDIFFQNTSVYIFTWSAFALIGVFGCFVKRSSRHYFLKITLTGILSVFFFFVWTNFGWWLTSSMYEMNLQGLLKCYIAGIPFLKNQLVSSLIFIPSFSFLFSFVYNKFSIKEKGFYLKTEG